MIKEANACAGLWGPTITFGAGSVSTTLAIFDNDTTPSALATVPDGWPKAEIRTVSQATPLATITTPTYTLTVKKGEAYNRNIRFRNI